ncbi:radical SAM protein [Nodosilinea sp. LEGE 07298]|uniref:radical SAM protein n=1 Tax=Nodosilinea sp. LEGE 07298 TaxID=2777970 RepID=UPI001882F9A6|nr:radical SAM protein [Nodosilinea sp. LEGE 07298]MBE9109124.1 radical SAM protein [Nodosilinea sp. LEGE 07298]
MSNKVKNYIKANLGSKQLGFAKKILKAISLPQQAFDESVGAYLNNFFPSKPETLNLLVNDVCNSRCQMCLIWQNKKDKELTPDELSDILSDGLFENIKYIGVSGGEPTLRSDLPEIYKAICSKSPKIKSTGVITNGIIHDVVKKRILESAAICQEHGINFNIMISIDGIEEIHDIVRGRKDNFESAVSLLKFFHEETDIPTSFGCTITTSNALYVDELLDYAKAERLYGRFRVAEYINRLYNAKQTQFIRSFDDKTSYHLGLFFFRAEHDFETAPSIKKTYKNIRGMLAENKPRFMGCPYQSKAVVLSAKGELLYCSPKSPSLGSTLDNSAKKLYFSNLFKRKEIIEKECSNCIHDYHVPLTARETVTSYIQAKKRRNKYSCLNLLKSAFKLSRKVEVIEVPANLSSESVLVVGWYGTETAGDKAILWSIINNLRSREHPPQNIYLSSLYPFISQWTLKEMSLDNISIVETYSKEFEATCNKTDEVVVGGGPLMDIEALGHILYAFIQATKNNAITRVEGCGIGPLKSPLYMSVVSEIFILSSHITLRDKASTARSLQELSAAKATTIPDPATEYVRFVKNSGLLEKSRPILGAGKNISCFLREWSVEYRGDLSQAEFNAVKLQFEKQLAQLVLKISDKKKLNVHLLPMHTFHVGGDDRVFNRKFAKKITSLAIENQIQIDVAFARGPISPIEILQSMYHSQLSLCMRFHSVLFAENLGVPYLAIDYTNGGKIRAFLESKNKLDRLISLQDIALGIWQDKLKCIEECA